MRHSYIEYVMLRSLFYRLEGKTWDYIFNHIIKVYLHNPAGSFMGETVSSMLIRVPGTSLVYSQFMGMVGCHRQICILERKLSRTDLDGHDLEARVTFFPTMVVGFQNPLQHLVHIISPNRSTFEWVLGSVPCDYVEGKYIQNSPVASALLNPY